MNLTKYRLSPTRLWVEHAPWLVTVVPCDEHHPLKKPPCETRIDFFEQYTTRRPRAAFETTVEELLRWVRRGCEPRDRQWVLGGIFDRALLREGLRDLERAPQSSKVTLWAAQSPAHSRGNFVLVVRCGDFTCCLMCCAEWAETGSDPFPLGRSQKRLAGGAP